MKQTYIVLSILLSALNMGSIFAITGLQYAALGSEKVVRELLDKGKAGKKLTPSEKIKVEANLNSLSFTQPKTAEKYKQIIKANSYLAETFPLFSKGITITNLKTKKPVIKKDIVAIKEEFREEVKKDLALFENDPKKATEEYVKNQNIATKSDAAINEPVLNLIVQAEKEKYEDEHNVEIDPIVDQMKLDPKKIELEAIIEFEDNYELVIGPKAEEERGQIAAAAEKARAIRSYLGLDLTAEILALQSKPLAIKMGIAGYMGIFGKLLEKNEEFADLKNLSIQDMHDTKTKFEEVYNKLWTLVTNDLLAQTRDYIQKQGGYVIGRSQVSQSIRERCIDIDRDIATNKILKPKSAFVDDIKIYILNYTNGLNKNIVTIFEYEIKPEKNKMEKFSKEFAKFFFGLDDISQDLAITNNYSIRGLIGHYEKYVDFLINKGNQSEANEYRKNIIAPLQEALSTIFDIFWPAVSHETAAACKQALELLGPAD